MSTKDKLAVLYINGLGDGSIGVVDRLVKAWWELAGVEFKHAQVNWFDEEKFNNHLERLVGQAKGFIHEFGRVAIIGSSAGGSMAGNVFGALKGESVCLVSSRGRLRVGDYDGSDPNSLHRRAYLHTSKPSQSFFDSVKHFEDKVLPHLTDEDRQRILILSQLTDMVVPLSLMSISGVEEHRSFALGHAGGYLAHMFTDRDLIIDFALQNPSSVLQ